AALELVAAVEQGLAAAGAQVFAGGLVAFIFAGEGAFRPRLAQNAVLFGRQPLAPALVAQLQFLGHRLLLRPRIWAARAPSASGRAGSAIGRSEIGRASCRDRGYRSDRAR